MVFPLSNPRSTSIHEVKSKCISQNKQSGTYTIFFLWERNGWPLNSSFHFCSTAWCEWFSCRYTTPFYPTLSLKYWINLNLFSNDCISLTLLGFFLHRFSFMNMQDSQDREEREGYLFNSSLPLPPALQMLRH